MTVAIVTGGASGVGAATAAALAEHNVAVAVCDVNPAGADVAGRCGGIFVPLDVADADAWEAALTAVHDALGPVDLAHLNAGIMTARPDEAIELAMNLDQVSVARYQRVVAVNLGGVVLGLRALWAGMVERGSGAIVATASAAGISPYPFDPVYTAAKHAVVGLVRATAPVLGAYGVRVQAICPGGVDTPLLPDYGRAAGLPLLAPRQVAAAVVDLLLTERPGSVFSVDAVRPEATPVPDPEVHF